MGRRPITRPATTIPDRSAPSWEAAHPAVPRRPAPQPSGSQTVRDVFALYGDESLAAFRAWCIAHGSAALPYSGQLRLAEAWTAGYDRGVEDAL